MSNVYSRLSWTLANTSSVCISSRDGRFCLCDPAPGWCPGENGWGKSHQVQMASLLPLAGNSLCSMMAVTKAITGVQKYYVNSMHPSYTAQNVPKYWTYWTEKNGLCGEACHPRKRLGIVSISSWSIAADTLAEMRLVRGDNRARGMSVQSFFPFTSTLSEQEKSSFLMFVCMCIYNSSKRSQWGLFVEKGKYRAVIHDFPGWNKCSKKQKPPDVTGSESWTRKAYFERERV